MQMVNPSAMCIGELEGEVAGEELRVHRRIEESAGGFEAVAIGEPQACAVQSGAAVEGQPLRREAVR